jgi:hypothetical protein
MMDGNLRGIFRKKLPDFFWTSVESGMTGRGIPDSHYCYAGHSGWIEYKVTSAFAVGLRPEQVAWLTRYARYGGACFVAVRRKRKDVDELWLIHGEGAASLKQEGLAKVDPAFIAGVFTGGPAQWSWATIEVILL